MNSGVTRKILKGIRDPTATSRFIIGGRGGVVSLYQERFAKSLGLDGRFAKYIREPSEAKDFATHLKNPLVRRSLGIGPGPVPLPVAELLYALCRSRNPEIVVETGVGSGFSSAFILLALDKNTKGRLYSVDFPNATYHADHREVEDTLAANLDPGWFVPERLKGRWTLHIGKTQEDLDPLLSDLGRVDLFFRDSEHVYSTMMFEFQTAWRRMPKGSVLLSDNATVNTAFDDFCEQVHASRTARFLEMAATIKD